MGVREQQALEVKLEAMALLAGGVAHDFKNFLTVALGYIEMASAEAAFPEKVTLYCDKALTALQRSTRLMQQMLAFTRVAAPAKQPLEFERFLKNTVLIAIGESKITAEFMLDARSAKIEADERQIAQAITIVVANAVQAMAGSGRLVVKTAVQTFAPGEHFALTAGDYCVVSFTDSGEGIAPGCPAAPVRSLFYHLAGTFRPRPFDRLCDHEGASRVYRGAPQPRCRGDHYPLPAGRCGPGLTDEGFRRCRALRR